MNRNFSKTLFFQSIPSLFLSLLGLAFTGQLLEQSLSAKYSEEYPLIFIINCILSFKSNIELILAMNLSTMSQSMNMQRSKYNRYIFDNSCLVSAQSIIIGLCVGLFVATKRLITDGLDYKYVITVISGCLVSCLVSSVIIIIMLVASIKLSLRLKLNPDNIILPTVSSIGDLLGVISSIFFIQIYDRSNARFCIVSLLLVLILFPLLIYIFKVSKNKMQQQKGTTILLTYILSTLASYIFDKYSKSYKILTSLSPIFCGLCGSISYLYINKKITCFENGKDIEKRRIVVTLLGISLLFSIFYTFSIYILMAKLTLLFYILFVIFFILHVYILLFIVDYITKPSKNTDKNTFIAAMSLLISFSDLIGIIILISVIEVCMFFE